MNHEQDIANIPDSLFDLPLFPETTGHDKGRNVAEQQLTTAIQEKLASFSIAEAKGKLLHEKENVWLERGQKRAIALFHAAAAYIPAYKEVLKKHSVNPKEVKTFKDFVEIVPIIDKESYIQKYPLNERYWHGQLPNADMIVASSGTHGKTPTMWPRNQILEAQAYLDHELAMAEMFELEKKSTLVVICFAMGMHIAGTITMQSMVHLSRKGYPLSVITPGNITKNILSIVKELSGSYDQTILAGYPPYMKEVVDRGFAEDIDWKKIKTRFVFAAEGFNESWRTYMAELTNSNPLTDFLSIYGSADAAVMAQETPASITLRRKILEKRELRAELFKNQRLPALFQYYPEHKYIEEVNGEIVLTATAGIPLIRYNIHDQGGVLNYSSVSTHAELAQEVEGLKSHQQISRMPFLYVYGRDNQTAVLYGANIYMEHIKSVIETQKFREKLSGKAVMTVKNDNKKDQRLYIEVECAKGTDLTEELKQDISTQLLEVLTELNSEYKDALEKIGDKIMPIVKLSDYGAKKFHRKRMKHSWVNKKK